MGPIKAIQVLRVVHYSPPPFVSKLSWASLCPSSHSNLHFRPIHSRQVSTERAINIKSGLNIDPYAYTSGQWLRHDKLERGSRYIKFDFNALCQRVIDLCSGANTIIACRKIEGGFNRVFIFTLDNAKRIVARLPFPLAGPTKLTTASEVATIRYLQAKTGIPLPTILDWSDDAMDPSNAIGSEYIIMEHATGVPLHKKWQEMSGDQQVKFIDAICRKIKEMIDLELPVFGSIYFSDAPFYSAHKQHLDKDFCVGPHCGTRYWDCNPGEQRYYHHTKPNHGPCRLPRKFNHSEISELLIIVKCSGSNIEEYANSLIDAGLSRVPLVDAEPETRPIYHGSVQTHLQLLEYARNVLRQMSADHQIQHTATPLLFHPDLHGRNIFVSEDDPSIITCIIDWQSASIEPAFWYSDKVPDFATENEICTETFKLCLQSLTPKVSAPMLMNENLFRPFRYSYRTWKDGAVALRHDMIQTARYWKYLGFEDQCLSPIPTPEELADHKMEYKLFEAAQDLRRDLSSLLNIASDGWVPSENWEVTRLAHKELFNGMLEAVLTNPDPDDDEPVRDERTLRSIWPFDIDE